MTNKSEKPFLRSLTEKVVTLLVLVTVSCGVLVALRSWMLADYLEPLTGPDYHPDSGLEITAHRQRLVDDDLAILGTLENRGDVTWTSIVLEVELFDTDGQFVDECSEYLRGHYPPDSTENFKVDCSRCKQSTPDFATYTINVQDASSL